MIILSQISACQYLDDQDLEEFEKLINSGDGNNNNNNNNDEELELINDKNDDDTFVCDILNCKKFHSKNELIYWAWSNDDKEMEKNECKHKMAQKCMIKHIQSQLNGDNIPRCPMFGCQTILSQITALQYLNDQDLEKFETLVKNHENNQ